jgi:hypothetical protein
VGDRPAGHARDDDCALARSQTDDGEIFVGYGIGRAIGVFYLLFLLVFLSGNVFADCFYPFCKIDIPSDTLNDLCVNERHSFYCKELSARYENGYDGKPEDLATAAYFLERACEFAEERYDCSAIKHAYLFGKWLGSTKSEPNIIKALYYLEYACERFHPEAKEDCMAAGVFYENGLEIEGVKKDAARSFKLFKMSCNEDGLKSDNLYGCWHLSNFYREGIETPKDEAKAKHLTEYACSLGSEEACQFLKKKPNPKKK